MRSSIRKDHWQGESTGKRSHGPVTIVTGGAAAKVVVSIQAVIISFPSKRKRQSLHSLGYAKIAHMEGLLLALVIVLTDWIEKGEG